MKPSSLSRDETKLLPCPFCGGAGHVHTQEDPDGFGKFVSVECRTCHARSPAKFVRTGNECPQFYQEVRDQWNGRDVAPTKALANVIAAVTRLAPPALAIAIFTEAKALHVSSETRTIPNLLGYVRSLNAAGRRDFQNDLVAALNYCREKRDE